MRKEGLRRHDEAMFKNLEKIRIEKALECYALCIKIQCFSGHVILYAICRAKHVFSKHVINENCPCDENLVKHDKKNSPTRLRHVPGGGAKLQGQQREP